LTKRRNDSEERILERIRRVFNVRLEGNPETHPKKSRVGHPPRRTNPPRNLETGSRFVSLEMGDDAALVRPARGWEMVLTCDWFLQGTHFLRDKHPADAVGWKCLARAVSDVAAMGGVPRCFLLSLALPKDLTGAWMDGFLGGLRRAAARFGCVLVGGDTTERREVLINVTVIGEVRAGRALRRSGARVGDIIYVSGRLGEAELGLRLLRGTKRRVNLRDAHLRKHLYPEPRLALGRWLSEQRVATAMMDLSDGLSSDLRRLCAASGAGAQVEAERLPVVPVSEKGRCKDRGDALHLAVHGGDDYELLFTVAKSKARRVPQSLGGVKIAAIGEITREYDVMIVDRSGRGEPLEAGGWDPFRRLRSRKT
jgi:thiamine-monophosphate kinase